MHGIYITDLCNTLPSFEEYLKIGRIPEFPENLGISGKSRNFGKCRGKFPGFRGKLFFGISEIPKLSETFSGNFLFFIKTAL
jgi:hypothetical protein